MLLQSLQMCSTVGSVRSVRENPNHAQVWDTLTSPSNGLYPGDVDFCDTSFPVPCTFLARPVVVSETDSLLSIFRLLTHTRGHSHSYTVCR